MTELHRHPAYDWPLLPRAYLGIRKGFGVYCRFFAIHFGPAIGNPRWQIGFAAILREDAEPGEIIWRFFRRWWIVAPISIGPIWHHDPFSISASWTGRSKRLIGFSYQYGFGLRRRHGHHLFQAREIAT